MVQVARDFAGSHAYSAGIDGRVAQPIALSLRASSPMASVAPSRLPVRRFRCAWPAIIPRSPPEPESSSEAWRRSPGRAIPSLLLESGHILRK